MSSATKEILSRVRQLVPPMLDKFHKGESPPPPSSETAASGRARDRATVDRSAKRGWDMKLTLGVKRRAAGPHRCHRWQ